MKSMGWETFGRTRAQLDAGLDRDVVLAEAGIQPTTWMAEEEAALAELADDVEAADFVSLEAYSTAYRSTWTEVTGLSMDDAPQVAGGSSPPLPPPIPPGEPPIVAIQKASFQLALPIAPLTPASPSIAATGDPLDSQEESTLPGWLECIPAADQTLPPLGLEQIATNALPFIAGASAPPAPPVASVPAADPVDETLVPSGFVVENPLPFQPAPSPGVASGPASGLTLEQYASLCAELAVFPQQVEMIFRKYGIASLRERLTLDLAWQERLRHNLLEYVEWHEFYQRYQTYWADPAHHDGPR